MPPPQAVRNTYLYPNYGERRYVATTGTDATTDDQGLSAAKPWKTLQYAADNAPSNAVIHVAAGDYDEGFNVQSGDVTNRLYIANRIRFVADEGPAATRILGAPDPSVTDPDAVGCGAGAIRCVCAKKGTHSCVQGFTLENGHTQSNSNNADGLGGGYSAGYKSYNAYLVDSVVTNCSGSRGAVYGGVVSRCLIVGNKIEKNGNGVTRGTALVSSIVRANDSVSRTGSFADLGQDVVAINSTVDTSVNGYSLNHLIDIVNSIVDGGDITNDGVLRTCAGTLFSPNTTYYPALDGRYGDPCFLDKVGGDYRLYACSPAVQGAGTNDYTIMDAWRYVSGDYEGRPFAFNASGTPIAGALQATAPGRALYVAADGPGAAGATVVPSGVTVLADDTPVTVTTAGSSRPCVGLEINGVFQPGLTATTIDPTTLGPNEGVRVRVLFSTDWYVDAVKGNDANTGWATNAAMKTLVGVMAKAAQGDTVHALPGVYNEGSAVHDGAYLDATSKGWGEAPIPARVVVQTNVTLAAMGTADETVIEGALGTQRSTRATGSTYETYALGTNAVRCVFLNEGSVVQGFTLRNGRVNASSEQDDNGWGAGVLGRGYDTATVVDCVVSNCASWRGAAGYQATFRRCHVVENKTPGNSCAGRKCAYYGCYIARNQDMIGQWGGLVASVYDFIGNTVAADNYNNSTTAADKAKGVRTVTSQESPTTSRFWNNVILQSYDATYAQDKGFLQAALKNAYQNFFASESSFPTPTSGANNEFGYASAALKIGADGVPACDSPVVDMGDFAYVATNLVGEADLNGVPRGRNGNRPDVGAFEQPWLPRYAQDIGGRRLTVTDASCAVFENASQKVEIPSGHLALAWQPLANGSGDAVVALEVTGNGTLTVYKDGVAAASYTAGTHAWQFAAVGGTTYALDFVYEPGENDTGAAIVHLAKLNVGFVLMMR